MTKNKTTKQLDLFNNPETRVQAQINSVMEDKRMTLKQKDSCLLLLESVKPFDMNLREQEYVCEFQKPGP